MPDPTVLPSITGPVTGGRHGWPFGSPVADVRRHDDYSFDIFTRASRAVAPNRPRVGTDPWAAWNHVICLFSVLSGSCVPFPPEKMLALYGDKTTYLARCEEAARRARESGVLLRRDAEALLQNARDQIFLD